MSSDKESNFLKKMAKFRESFIEKLPEDFAQLAQYMTQLEQPDANSEILLQDIAALLHKMAGTAGTFQLMALHEAAKAMQILCKEHSGAIDDDFMQQLKQHHANILNIELN